MKYLFCLFIPILLACNNLTSDNNNGFIDPKVESIQEVLDSNQIPICPKNHTDSILPIVYGDPGPDLWAKADSGLVALGGCELGEERNYCTIHKISF